MYKIQEQIKWLVRHNRISDAISLINECLVVCEHNPHLLNRKGDLLQLLESETDSCLDGAEKCYLEALNQNENDLEAIESLAHFYDAVLNDDTKSVLYAKLYIKKTTVSNMEMDRIIKNAHQS